MVVGVRSLRALAVAVLAVLGSLSSALAAAAEATGELLISRGGGGAYPGGLTGLSPTWDSLEA